MYCVPLTWIELLNCGYHYLILLVRSCIPLDLWIFSCMNMCYCYGALLVPDQCVLWLHAILSQHPYHTPSLDIQYPPVARSPRWSLAQLYTVIEARTVVTREWVSSDEQPHNCVNHVGCSWFVWHPRQPAALAMDRAAEIKQQFEPRNRFNRSNVITGI